MQDFTIQKEAAAGLKRNSWSSIGPFEFAWWREDPWPVGITPQRWLARLQKREVCKGQESCFQRYNTTKASKHNIIATSSSHLSYGRFEIPRTGSRISRWAVVARNHVDESSNLGRSHKFGDESFRDTYFDQENIAAWRQCHGNLSFADRTDLGEGHTLR